MNEMKAIDSGTRQLSPEAAAGLYPGADHYRAYIGHADQYDFMGATQFRLLTALGLREHHQLLDLVAAPCAQESSYSLSTARQVLDRSNKWLIEEAIEKGSGAISLPSSGRPSGTTTIFDLPD